MSDLSTRAEAPAAAELRIGTLSYSRAGLRKLFFWLLAGDVVFMFMDQIEPKVLPIVLKQHGATDTDIALIVSSTAALMQFFVSPVLSYRSDRTRTPRGRRIPYLLWATPFAALLLAATPFAPEIAGWLFTNGTPSGWPRFLPSKPVVFVFLLLALGYRFFHAIISGMFFALFRDVVPRSHMGRFLALFRMVGALATFAVTYWLVGHAETHARAIFVGVGVFTLVGFWVICRYVKEGEYPPVAETQTQNRPAALWSAIKDFVSESYRHPIYWWTYGARLLVYAAGAVAAFMVFFPQRELGMTFTQVGHVTAWPALVWLVVGYPIGRATDRWGSMVVLGIALTALTTAYALSFVLVTGWMTFLVSSIVTGVLYWVVMMSQIALSQQIFHGDRYAQLSSANVLLQSLAIFCVISPAAGMILDHLQGYHAVMTLPVVGAVQIGPYRFVNLMLAALYGLSGLCLYQVYRHWRRLGGAEGRYVAPL